MTPDRGVTSSSPGFGPRHKASVLKALALIGVAYGLLLAPYLGRALLTSGTPLREKGSRLLWDLRGLGSPPLPPNSVPLPPPTPNTPFEAIPFCVGVWGCGVCVGGVKPVATEVWGCPPSGSRPSPPPPRAYRSRGADDSVTTPPPPPGIH